MDYIHGQPLDKLWPTMSPAQNEEMARHWQGIVQKMGSVTPPSLFLSSLAMGLQLGTEIVLHV